MQSKPSSPYNIVILGGGTAGWICANLMAHHWADKNIRITIIDSPQIGTVGVGEGSTPHFRILFDRLGIKERAWMPSCHATYKNGIRFTGWLSSTDENSYFHPFPSQLDDYTASAFFFNSVLRRRGADVLADPDRFFLSQRLGKFHLSPMSPEAPFNVEYSYHFDAHKVGQVLREHAKSLDVKHKQGRISNVSINEAGLIDHLRVEDGRVISGDLFIDCSGFRSLILQQALKVGFRSYKDNLFNDAAVTVATKQPEDHLASETKAIAMSTGWRWQIPLTNRCGNGYVYSRDYQSAEDAETELRSSLGLLDKDAECRHLSMKVGQVEKHWSSNCVAVGLSQGFIEPLEATALHLVQETVECLLLALDNGDFTDRYANEFNQNISRRFEGIRDYIVGHYKLNGRTDTRYWEDNRVNNHISDNLRSLIQCWKSGDDLNSCIMNLGIDKYYSVMSWHCLFAGYDIFPSQDALSKSIHPDHKVDLSKIDDLILQAAARFKNQKEFLRLQSFPERMR